LANGAKCKLFPFGRHNCRRELVCKKKKKNQNEKKKGLGTTAARKRGVVLTFPPKQVQSQIATNEHGDMENSPTQQAQKRMGGKRGEQRGKKTKENR